MAKWKPRKLRETGKAGIESQLRDYMRRCGGISYKHTSPGTKGIPDRVFSHKSCGPFWMEIKQKGKDLEELQDQIKGEMISHGFRVYGPVDSFEAGKAIIDSEVYGL